MNISTELTVGLHSDNESKLEITIAALSATLLAALVCSQMTLLNREMTDRLVVAFGSTARVPSDLHLPVVSTDPNLGANLLTAAGYCSIVGWLAVAAAATFIFFKLVAPPRYIALVILFALSLVYEMALWQAFGNNLHPLGFLVALLCGVLAGSYLRQKQSFRRREESQYYELKLKNRELLETRLELLKQDEVERRILAADLHDQVLNDLKQVVHRFEKYTKEPDPENAAKITALTSQVMREIREVMDSLSPSVLEHLGLAAAIEDCLRRGSERAEFRTRFKSRVDNDELEVLSIVEKGLLYRLVQESITNICKHAQANTVRATMETDGDELVIRINDDGKGMDPAMSRGDSRGLKYMRYRADLIGATIAWTPGDNGKGTAVAIRINLGDRRAQQAAAAKRTVASNQNVSSQDATPDI